MFMCFTSTCFSIFYSTVDNPKWLKFIELRHGKFVYEDLSCCLSRLSCEISGHVFEFHQICHLLQSKIHLGERSG